MYDIMPKNSSKVIIIMIKFGLRKITKREIQLAMAIKQNNKKAVWEVIMIRKLHTCKGIYLSVVIDDAEKSKSEITVILSRQFRQHYRKP